MTRSRPSTDTQSSLPRDVESARWLRRNFGAAALLLLAAALCAWPAPPTATAATPPDFHTLLKLPLTAQSPRVHRFRLPLAGLRVEVVDLHYELPLADALADGDLVVNGGYWGWLSETKRRIIGLLIAGGKEWAPLRSTLDGGVLLLHEGKASIAASRGYSAPASADLAIQCRPRLIDAGKLIPNLNTRGRAARTAVCVRDAGRTLDIYLTEPDDLGPNLHDLGRWLLEQGCEYALNLDGGPSTAAGYRDNGKLVRVGSGRELPYALRFKYTP